MEQAGSVFRISRRAMILTGVLIIVFLCGMVLGYRYVHLLRCEERVRENLHSVQLAIERWKINHGIINCDPAQPPIPGDLETYIAEGVLAEMPVNPFTGKPVRLVTWGEHPTPGDITFLVAKEYFCSQEQATRYTDTSYQLLAYSVRRQTTGLYLDSDQDTWADPVILTLEGGGGIGTGFREGTESLTDTLARRGYLQDIFSPLPDDSRPFWRWMFFLDPAG